MNTLTLPVGALQANCYLVWDDDGLGCAVDCGGEPEKVVQVLVARKIDLKALLVTHGHFDHIEGVAGVAEATGAKVYCSDLASKVILGEQGCSAVGLPVPSVGSDEVVVVEDGSDLVVGDLNVRVLSTPGHTPGDLTYEIGGSLFCGDLLFRGSVGRTDFPGGDFGALLDSVRRLTENYGRDTVVYPGHMEQTTLGDEMEHNPFLRELRTDA